MRYKFFICIGIACAIGAACQPTGLYYWGGYSTTLANQLKEPSDATLAAHRETLQDIIEKSNQRSKRVPPGIHAEFGMIELRAGNTKEAIRHFNLEQEIYPESATLMKSLIARASASGKQS